MKDEGRMLLQTGRYGRAGGLICALCWLLLGQGYAAAQTSQVAPELLWKVRMKGALLSTPAVQGASLYIPMPDNKIYRMDVKNGRHEVIGKLEGMIPVPPEIQNDRMFLSIIGQKKRDIRALLAYDIATKKTVWQRPFRNGWSGPLISGETLYVGSEDGAVHAVSAATGETLWRFQTGRLVRSTPVVSDSLVFVGSDDRHLYALHAQTGRQVWACKTGGSVSAAPATAGDAVYAVSYDRTLYCVDRTTGQRRWTFRAEGSLYGSPTVHGNRVFLGSNDRQVYCVDAMTGRLLWQYRTEGVVRASPVVSGDLVYIASTDKRLYALHTETGELVWQYETAGSITVPPVIVDGVLIVGSEDRYLYAFKERNRP